MIINPKLIKANITWSLKQVVKMIDAGSLKFDNIFQRSYVWERERQSRLIWSVMEGYPIPAFYARRMDGKYDFLDGKQRMEAFRAFLHDEFALAHIFPVHVQNEEGNEIELDLNGKKYSQLPEEIQDVIKDYHVAIYYYDNITDEQVRILFANLNNGKPLSTKDRNIANCTDLASVTEIGKHPLFSDSFTEKSLEQRKQIPIVMKIWIMLNEQIQDVTFESKVFNEVIEDTVLSDEDKTRITAVLDKLYSIYLVIGENPDEKTAKKVQRKMMAETNLVSLIPFIVRAIDEEISDELIAGWVWSMFSTATIVSSDYMFACQASSAKSASIKARNKELEKSWDSYFTVESNE